MTRARGWYVVGFVLSATVLARILLSVQMIRLPGLSYDETLFVNAATLRLPNWFMPHQVLGIPLWVYPYIGALKSWLYAPIFSLFGTAAATVRVPMVILVSGSLVLLYLALRDLLNRSVALLTVVLLAFDQSLLWYTRDDIGPSAIEFALKCAGLYCIARLFERRSPRWVVLLLVVLGADVFNKANFIWVVNAAAVISVVLAVRHRMRVHAWGRSAWVWFGGLGLIYVAFGAYYLHIDSCAGYGCAGSFALRWSQFTHGTATILSGTSFYDYALAPIGTREPIALAMLGLFDVGALASVAHWRGRSPVIAGLALGTILVALQCLFTYQATGGWHYIAIYPFFIAVAAYGVYALALVLLRTPKRIYAAMALVGIAALVYNGLLFATYQRALTAEPSNYEWSAAIYPLSRYLDHEGGTVFVTEWGIANQLLTLAPSRRYRDMYWLLGKPYVDRSSTAVPLIRKLVAQNPGPKLFVSYVSDRLWFVQTQRLLLEAVGARLSVVQTINGANGDPAFRIYGWR